MKAELTELEEELAQEPPVARESGALQSQLGNVQVSTMSLTACQNILRVTYYGSKISPCRLRFLLRLHWSVEISF